MISRLLASGMFFFGGIAFAAPGQLVQGYKYPNSPAEGTEPVSYSARVVDSSKEELAGFSALVPFVLASPDQDEAGSCLYMSLTGIAEWWLAKTNPTQSRSVDGPLDLSERYFMNLSSDEPPKAEGANFNWKTDSILFFNKDHKSVLNKFYRFTKGWFGYDSNGNTVASTEGAAGATYGTQYNWLDERSTITQGYMPLPEFQRDVIFADPESNQWNVGVAPDDIVDTVKKALKTKQAPVQVIYNHFGYWHSVFIVGYNDAEQTQCPFVEKFRGYLVTEPLKLRDQAAAATDPAKKKTLLARAAKFEATSVKLEAAYTHGLGCQGQGTFYVRDSIYPDDTAAPYDYDTSRTGDEAPISKKIVVHEYEWLRYMSNHAIQITVR